MRSEIKEIDEYILSASLYCSSFVLQEFRMLFIKPLMDLFFIINNQLDYDPKDCFKQLKTVYSFKPRRLQVSYDILVELATSNGGMPTNKTQALSKIDSLVRETELKFKENIKAQNILYHTNCRVGAAALGNSGNSYKDLYEFSIQLNGCKNFCCRNWFLLKKHKPKFQDIVQSNLEGYNNMRYPYTKRKEFFNKLIPLYKKIANEDHVTDKELSEQLGDTIIAIESPASCTLLSYDHVYQILCEILDKPYYVFSYSSIKKLQSITKS